jgi:hypothetical protein
VPQSLSGQSVASAGNLTRATGKSILLKQALKKLTIFTLSERII